MKKKRWLLPTNTNNLRVIISQGLITSHDGFSKYYKDVLEQHNGWIPIFSNTIPSEALKYATSEDPKSLTACLMELDIIQVNGHIKALKGNQLIDLELKNKSIDDEEIIIIFVPAPLPLSCLSKVLFESKAKQTEFQIDAKNRSNVILNNLKLQSTKADQKLFQRKHEEPNLLNQADTLNSKDYISFSQELPQSDKINYPEVYAFGGMLSLLFYYAKNGQRSNLLYEKTCTNDTFLSGEDYTEGIILILDYFFNKTITESSPSKKKKMYHGILEIAIVGKDFKNEILDFLENSNWEEKKVKDRAAGLARMLREYESNLSKKSVSTQFEEAKSELEKMLLMLFVREDSDSFAEYKTVIFEELEYLIFAMLFGIRDKFRSLPAWLKKYNNLQEFISTKMAEYAQQSIKSNLKFKISHKPFTVWEILDKKLEKKTIKALSINNCIETIMPKSNFSFSQKDSKVTYSSFVEPTYNIIKDKYFKEISSLQITNEIYNKL